MPPRRLSQPRRPSRLLWLVGVGVLVMGGSAAWAQPLKQCGAMTVGHLAMYGGLDCLLDAGGITQANTAPANNALPGTLASGLPIVNSGQGLAFYSNYATAPYSEALLGFDGNGNFQIRVDRVGGGPPPTATLLLNGQSNSLIGSYGAGVATFLATPSSANLRAALTDPSGTGLAYFQGGALGTPASGIATNLTGTAAGLTAGTVATNANLTGPITSTGNATAIASQTGTGSKFVVDTSPTLVTPNLGAASASSLTGPAVYGGTAAGSSLTLQSTSNGAPAADNVYVVGNTITLQARSGSPTSLHVGLAGTSSAAINIAGTGTGSQIWQPANNTSGTITFPAGSTDFSATGGPNRAVMQTSVGGALTVEAMLRPDASNATLPTARANLGIYSGTPVTGNLPVYFNSTGTTQDSGVAPKTSGAAYSLVGNPNSSPAGLQDISTDPVGWTPVDASGQGLTFVSASGFYTKIGRLCFVTFGVIYPAAVDANPARITGLPVTCTALTAGPVQSVTIGFSNNTGGMTAYMANGDVYIQFNSVGDGNLTNTAMSGKTVDGSITVLTN